MKHCKHWKYFISGTIHLVRTQSGGGGLYKCVRLRTWGRGGGVDVRTNFYSHKNEKTTELSLTRIQTLQDLFYRTNYKQMRYMNNLRD